jgi:hypothetical protein
MYSLPYPKKNNNIQTFLQPLTPTDSTVYSLWKVTKEITQITGSSSPQGTWSTNNAEKPHAFAKNLEQVFKSHTHTQKRVLRPLVSKVSTNFLQIEGATCSA